MAVQTDSPEAADALESLCRAYWYPLYAYVRRRGHDISDAEDLTQEFFARLLLKGFAAGVLREGGKFRSYLLAALKNFLINDWNRCRTAKRGAGEISISLEELGAEARYRLEPADEASPEKLFERRWASTLLDGVRRRLRDEYATEGREVIFNKLKACLTGSEQLMSYSFLSAELGMSDGAVKMAVHRLRKRYGEVLRKEIALTVSSPEEVDEEIRCLIAAAGR